MKEMASDSIAMEKRIAVAQPIGGDVESEIDCQTPAWKTSMNAQFATGLRLTYGGL